MGTVDQIRMPSSETEKRENHRPGAVEYRRSAISVADREAPSGVRVIPIAECFPSNEKEKKGLPVVIAPGFTEGIETLEPNLEYLARDGRHVFTFDAPQGISEGSESSIELANLGGMALHEYETRKALALLEVLKQKNIDGKIDAIGHSEGCIYLVLAALAMPEKFRTLLLENPGGMVGRDSFFSLIRRAYRHAMQERKTAQNDPVVRNRLKYAKTERRMNLMASLVEGVASPRAIACSQIEELLVMLIEKRVHIVIAHSADDLIFPLDRVSDMSSRVSKGGKTKSEPRQEGEDARSYLDGFYVISGGHNDFFLNPKAHALLANHAFSAIERKEQRIANASDIQEKAAA